VKLLIKAVDCIAMLAVLLGFVVAVATLIFTGIYGVVDALSSMLSNSSDTIVLVIVVAAVVWCAFRWKELNKRP
jgi:membrane protein DedA with SNARE-associated domain